MKSLSPTIAGSIGHFLKRCDLRLVLLPAALVLVFAAQALAQEATIVGTVTDPTGAAVPNVTITVTNIDTGLARTLTSSSDGQFVAPDLRIGRYTVRATASGFKVAEQKDIVARRSTTAVVSTSNSRLEARKSKSPSKPRRSQSRPIPVKSATSSPDNSSPSSRQTAAACIR